MFQSWRQRLHQASVAFKRGRLEQACCLLQEGDLREFLPAEKLAGRVAESLVERAQEMVAHGNTSAGWRDLRAAESLSDQARRLPNPELEVVLGEYDRDGEGFDSAEVEVGLSQTLELGRKRFWRRSLESR